MQHTTLALARLPDSQHLRHLVDTAAAVLPANDRGDRQMVVIRAIGQSPHGPAPRTHKSVSGRVDVLPNVFRPCADCPGARRGLDVRCGRFQLHHLRDL
jgi:hypothetical protein